MMYEDTEDDAESSRQSRTAVNQIELDGEVRGEVLVVGGEGSELLVQLDESLDLIPTELVDGFVIVPGDLVRVNDSGSSEDFDVGLLRGGLLRGGFLCR